MVVGCDRVQISRYLSEFFGTAILVCSMKIIMDQAPKYSPPEIAYSFYGLFSGITLASITYLFGYNSMGMFNPAITVAHALRNSQFFKFSDIDQWLVYFVLQVIGGVVGGFTAGAVGGISAGKQYYWIENTDYSVSEGFWCELFFTFILVSVHIHSGSDERIAGNQFYGIAIGAVLAVAGAAIGPISGCAINPAVWFGALYSTWYFLDADSEDLQNSKYTWIYPAAQFTAAIMAAMWFNIVYGGKEADGIEEESEEETEEEESELEVVVEEQEKKKKKIKKKKIRVVEDQEKEKEKEKEEEVPIIMNEKQDDGPTTANLLLFEVNDDNAREYGNKLMDEIMAVDGFEEQVYEKNLEKKGKKAKINFVIRQSKGQKPMDNPVIKRVSEMLEKDDKVKKIRVNTIPYFE